MGPTFDHVHIYARDLPRTLRFYTAVLGAEHIGKLPKSEGLPGDAAFNHILLLGGQFLALSTFPPGIAARTPPAADDGALQVGFGVAHIGLNVPSLDDLIPTLEREGYDLHSEPRGGEPVRYVYFTGPDGVVFELTQYQVSPKLAPAIKALAMFDRGVHAAKRAIGKRLLAAATAS
jgi:catechol 2,3-dioxygenase-like lactoylglutathione lyase family enzyme